MLLARSPVAGGAATLSVPVFDARLVLGTATDVTPDTALAGVETLLSTTPRRVAVAAAPDAVAPADASASGGRDVRTEAADGPVATTEVDVTVTVVILPLLAANAAGGVASCFVVAVATVACQDRGFAMSVG